MSIHFSITISKLADLTAAGHTIICKRSPTGRLVIYRVDDKLFTGSSSSQKDARILLKQLYEDLFMEVSF